VKENNLIVTTMSGSNNDQVQAHEERLQRLEEDAAEIAKQGVQLQHLTIQVSEGFAQISDKIEGLIKPLTEKLEKTDTELEAANKRVAALEVVEERRSRFSANLKKGLWLMAAGALAILGQKVLTLIWTLFP